MCKMAMFMYNIRMREQIIYFEQAPESHPFFHLEMTGISWCDGSYRIQRMDSPYYAVEYIMQGTGYLEINGQRYSPCRGDTYITHKGSRHFYGSSGEDPWIKVWVAFHGTLVDELMTGYRLDKVYHIGACDVEDELMNIYEIAESTTSEELRRGDLALSTHNLLHEIHTRINHHGQTSINPVEKAMAFLRMNISTNPNLDAIAKHADKSVSQLIRLFKEQTGKTPHELHLDMKTAQAKRMLRESSHSMQYIAYELGFCDAFHFSKTFKAHAGLCPTEYRKKHGHEFPEMVM